MQFKLWLENNLIDAAQVLQMIQQSPQFRARVDMPPDYWERYADQWGVQGTFVRVRLSVAKLVDLINNRRRLMISKNRDSQDVQGKLQSGARNPVIIGQPSGPFPYAILDGSHSLEAAHYAGDEWIDAIVPSNSEFASI